MYSRMMDPTSRFLGLGKGTVSVLNPFNLVLITTMSRTLLNTSLAELRETNSTPVSRQTQDYPDGLHCTSKGLLA